MNNLNLLKAGDTIILKKGMHIQAFIPENKHFLKSYDICIGDKLKIEKTTYTKSIHVL